MDKYDKNNIIVLIIVLILSCLLFTHSYMVSENMSGNISQDKPKSISQRISENISSIPTYFSLPNLFSTTYDISHKYTIDVKYQDIMTQFYNILTIMSSNKKAVVVINKNIILDGGKDGLNFIVFSRGDKLILKYIQGFDIGCCRNEMIDMIKFIENINQKDVVIIVSKGDPFKIFSNKLDKTAQLAIKSLKNLGARTKIFREKDNYLLLTSILGDIYYEDIGPEPLYFPYVNVIKKDCRINPANIKYPEKYVLFNDKSYDTDKMKKCAMESHMRGYDKFGLYKDYCIPMSDDQYYKSFEYMPESENCMFNEGNNNEITGYHIETINSYDRLIDNKKHGIIFYELHDFKGTNFVLNEGVYLNQEINRQRISSIYVPYKYFLILIKDDDIIPFYGPIKVNLTGFHQKYFDDFDTIIIQKHHPNNTVLCANYNNKQVCMTYDKGIHIFHPKLFLKIIYITLGDNVKKLSLYGNIASSDLIENVDRDIDGKSVKIKFPRIARSVKIL